MSEDWPEVASSRTVISEDKPMIERVVVPLDGSPLAARAVTPARSLAERTGPRWLMTDAVSPAGRSAMATFGNDKASWFYGLGLLPLCPCEPEGTWLRSSRYGLDSLIGSWAFDETTTATVFLDPDTWFDEDGPRREFYDLEASLLDASR